MEREDGLGEEANTSHLIAILTKLYSAAEPAIVNAMRTWACINNHRGINTQQQGPRTRDCTDSNS